MIVHSPLQEEESARQDAPIWTEPRPSRQHGPVLRGVPPTKPPLLPSVDGGQQGVERLLQERKKSVSSQPIANTSQRHHERPFQGEERRPYRPRFLVDKGLN